MEFSEKTVENLEKPQRHQICGNFTEKKLIIAGSKL